MESKTTDALDAKIEATNDENEVVRETATEALGILGNPNVIPILRKLALDDSEEFVRLAGVEALVRIDHGSILPALAKAARDENAHIRWFAMRWLASHPTDAIVPLLVTRLDDLFAPTGEEKRICDLAAEALEQLDSSEARQALENWRQASVN
jgi:HEAT repeat protein